jgi:hypothetical protein
MPFESTRVVSFKKIANPLDASQFVYVPVVDRITFVDQKSDSQESTWIFDNSENSLREVRTQRVFSTADESQYLDVERIAQFRVVDQKSDGQESTYRVVNDDPPPALPGGGGLQHLRTHVVRYRQSYDGPWIDVELIDQIAFVDPKSNSQEMIFTLDHGPTAGPAGDANDPYQPDIAGSEPLTPLSPVNSLVDPPWRLDPFRNIVNLSWQGDAPPENSYAVVWHSAGMPPEGWQFGNPAATAAAALINANDQAASLGWGPCDVLATITPIEFIDPPPSTLTELAIQTGFNNRLSFILAGSPPLWSNSAFMLFPA